jgi:hypothetical protein
MSNWRYEMLRNRFGWNFVYLRYIYKRLFLSFTDDLRWFYKLIKDSINFNNNNYYYSYHYFLFKIDKYFVSLISFQKKMHYFKQCVQKNSLQRSHICWNQIRYDEDAYDDESLPSFSCLRMIMKKISYVLAFTWNIFFLKIIY